MGKLLKSYFFWTYERGSLHYDVMVTAILLFLFVTPHYVNFKDRQVETLALQSSQVLITEAGTRGIRSRFLYQIRADDMGTAQTDDEIRTAITRIVEPISGEVQIDSYESVKDGSGRVVSYKAWVLR